MTLHSNEMDTRQVVDAAHLAGLLRQAKEQQARTEMQNELLRLAFRDLGTVSRIDSNRAFASLSRVFDALQIADTL